MNNQNVKYNATYIADIETESREAYLPFVEEVDNVLHHVRSDDRHVAVGVRRERDLQRLIVVVALRRRLRSLRGAIVVLELVCDRQKKVN